MRSNGVLISTLPVDYGKGVAAHTKYVLAVLRKHGYSVTLAYYLPYSMAPSLSVPSWRLGRRAAGSRVHDFEGVDVHEIGCWLPELEFTNYWPTRAWKQLAGSHRYLLAVTGNALAAMPFAAAGRPFLAWLGTPFTADRENRVKTYPLPRRVLDWAVNSPACRHYERAVLGSGLILPTTPYVASEFRRIAPRAQVLDPAPIPVDTDWFTPAPAAVEACHMAFIGKYNDARKNVFLLLDALKSCRDKGVDAVLSLYGDTPSPAVRERIRQLGLERAVRGLRKATAEELLEIYRSSAAFVIPSFQEGLCVAGLEAMACGCPVVTSACGGPEDYVADGVNGFIVPRETEAFTDAVLRIFRSPRERSRLSCEAAATVRRRFTTEAVEGRFLSAFARLR